jgi:hypothetical protein
VGAKGRASPIEHHWGWTENSHLSSSKDFGRECPSSDRWRGCSGSTSFLRMGGPVLWLLKGWGCLSLWAGQSTDGPSEQWPEHRLR